MATEILPIATGPADSAEVVVVNGANTTFALKANTAKVSFQARVEILMKTDAGTFMDVGELTPVQPALAIVGGGTFKFRRTGGEVGVFSA